MRQHTDRRVALGEHVDRAHQSREHLGVARVVLEDLQEGLDATARDKSAACVHNNVEQWLARA